MTGVRQFACCVILLVSTAAALAEDQKPKGPSLDEQLLKRLESESMDPIDRALLEPDKKGAAKPSLERLGPAGASKSDNDSPMLRVARQMDEARQRLTQADPGRTTQDLQRQVIDELDKLIRQARSQCKGGGAASRESPLPSARRAQAQPQQPSAGKSSSKPAAGSQVRTTPPAASRPTDADALRETLKTLWGDLPDKAREQMLQQFRVEEFLPQYESLLEAYFRRLAEQPEAKR